MGALVRAVRLRVDGHSGAALVRGRMEKEMAIINEVS